MKDATIKVSDETRYMLKELALKKRMTVKAYVEYIAKKEKAKEK